MAHSFMQFEYKTDDASLVLTTDNCPHIDDPTSCPCGEQTELQIDHDHDHDHDAAVVRLLQEEGSVLTSSDDDDGVYQPKTEDTRIAYEIMLSLIRYQLGEQQPLNIVSGAAHKILAVLKNATLLTTLIRRRRLRNLSIPSQTILSVNWFQLGG